MHFRAWQEPHTCGVQWIFVLRTHPAAELSSLKVTQLLWGGCGGVTMARIPAEVKVLAGTR